MAQHPIELILTRQLASYLAAPMFLVGPEGELLFYNEPAEALLGYRFDEALEIPLDEWATTYQLYRPRTGERMPIEEFPVVAAMRDGRPSHTSLLYQRPDGARVPIVATSIPLIGQGGELLGAVAIFWEDGQP
ncbi:MAG TPA: PAS domain-containing protein [Candidatus Limnocylindria bacterium]|jgi:PAS domain-containing protein|nr:PAS domain-containing protein [Candidatus Limnocylindria bacterium]